MEKVAIFVDVQNIYYTTRQSYSRHVIEYAELADVIILLSGDGDFDLLLNRVRDKYSVNSEVYGVQALTAPSLIKAASRFIAINENLLL